MRTRPHAALRHIHTHAYTIKAYIDQWWRNDRDFQRRYFRRRSHQPDQFAANCASILFGRSCTYADDKSPETEPLPATPHAVILPFMLMQYVNDWFCFVSVRDHQQTAPPSCWRKNACAPSKRTDRTSCAQQVVRRRNGAKVVRSRCHCIRACSELPVQVGTHL